jgi:HTH-type transcriptional regulator/antitoxin HigA
MATTALAKGRQPRAYFKLVQTFPLRPIRSDKELNEAVAVLDALIDRAPQLAEERDYMRVLGSLVEQYEVKTIPMRPSTDAEMLQFLMDANGLNQGQMAAAMSIPASTVSEIVKGRRKLTRRHISRLTARFRIPSAAFFDAECGLAPSD